MLARRLTTILPAMTLAEAIETTRIHRVAGLTGDRTALVTTRPFRAPHHPNCGYARARTSHWRWTDPPSRPPLLPWAQPHGGVVRGDVFTRLYEALPAVPELRRPRGQLAA